MYKKEKIPLNFMIYLLIFCIFSVISIYSAAIYISSSLTTLAIKQISWYLIGILFIYGISKIRTKTLYKYSWYLYFFSILLLLGLILFGQEINGSKSWYTIDGFGSFQPSEFMKIPLILMNAIVIQYFTKKKTSVKDEFKMIIILLILFFIPSLLCFMQPDTGSVIIFSIITLSMLFASGIRKEWFYAFFILIIAFILVFLYLYFYNQELFLSTFGNKFFYRMDRIMNWSNKSGMQLSNSLMAIGSSGLLGHGINNTPIYIPESDTDFIFAVFASNFGLIGTITLLVLFFLFNLQIIKICKNCKKRINKYVLVGIFSILLYQQIQNIGMTLGLIPITGITLPFISYGGSSLLSYLILLGIIINIKNDEKKNELLSK